MPRKNPDKSIEHPGSLLVRARAMAGISQRELAMRASTAQSVVARVENGETNPSLATLDRLLGAAGFQLRRTLEPKPVVNSHMLEDSERILRLSPLERLREVANISRFIAGARRV